MLLFAISILFKVAYCFVPDYGFGIGGLVAGKYHVDVTRDALKYVASQYFNEQKNRPEGSRHIPLNEDLFGVFGWTPNRIFETFYGKPVSGRSFAKAITAIQTGVASVDHEKNMKDNPNHHFDAERFHEANEVLIDLRIEVYNAIMSENYDAARNTMGILLHSLQDFYSHSNWIELGNTAPNSNLGIPGLRWGRKAKPFMPTCLNCTRSCVLKICTAYFCQNNLVSTLAEENLLTSGYYGGQNDGFVDVPKPPTVGKCSHGGLFDSSSDIPSVGGINKDSKVPRVSPHYYLHEEAIRLSRQASIDYLNGIRQDVHDDYKFGTFIGILVGPSLVFCVDPAGYLIDNKEAVQQTVANIIEESKNAGMQPKSYVVVPFNHPDFPPTFKSMNAKEATNYITALIAKSQRDFDSSENHLSNIDLGLKASDFGSKVFVFTNSTPKDVQLLPQVISQSVHNKQQISVIGSPTGANHRRKRLVSLSNMFGDVINKTVSVAINLNSISEDGISESGGDLPSINNVYGELVEKTGGHILTYSSTLSDVFSDTTLMQDSHRGSPVTILYMKSKDRGMNHIKFTIDPSMVSFVVTATCNEQFPHLLVTNPSGRENRGQIKSEHNGEYETSINVPSVTDKDIGQWNLYVLVNCSRPCNWTLVVKGYSTLYHSVNLKLLDVESNHPGLHKIVGRPIVTENVTIVFSLSSETAVLETAQVKDESGNILIDNLRIRPLEETGHFYAFFIVPGIPFLISVKGKDEMGYEFQRADLIIFPCSYFRITRIIPQNVTTKNLVPDGYLTLTFNITNLNILSRRSSMYFYALDYHYNDYIHGYGPYSTVVNLYDSFIANVILKAPATAKPGDIIRIQVNTGVHGTTFDNSLDLNVTVFPALADPVLPDCRIAGSIYDNICGTNQILGNDCWTATWNAIMIFSDAGTGLSSVAVDHPGGEVNMTLSNYNYVNLVSTNVTAFLEGDCCVHNVTLYVYNKIGRYGTCILQRAVTTTLAMDENDNQWTEQPAMEEYQN